MTDNSPNPSDLNELRDPDTGELISTAARYRTGPSAERVAYYAYEESVPLGCYRCGWQGTTVEASREYYEALFDVSCPRCDAMLLIVSYPTEDEMRAAAAAGNPKAIASLAKFEGTKSGE